MKILFILLTAVFSTAAMAQENAVINDPNAKTRTLNGSFTAISVSSGIELYLTQGQEESLAVSYSDEKYADRFKTVVEDNVLKIYYDNRGFTWNDNDRKKLKAYVSFKTLEKLTGNSGSDVKVSGTINAGNLDMHFSSGSTFKGAVKAKTITVEQSSGSDMNLSGTADKIVINTSSGSAFKGYEFTVDYCEAKASSGAEIHISVEKELSARASSGGEVIYKGAALIRDIDISSGAVVKKAK